MRQITEDYPGHRKVRLLIGDGGIYSKPTVVTTVLGSCVSVCFFCREKRIGAIFHALLPVMPEKEKNGFSGRYYHYVDSAIRHIMHSFYRRGIKQTMIEAKVFGGAQAVFEGMIQTGSKNILTAYEVLADHNIKIVASDVGGRLGRTLIFISSTGEVFIKNHKNTIVNIQQTKNGSNRFSIIEKGSGHREVGSR